MRIWTFTKSQQRSDWFGEIYFSFLIIASMQRTYNNCNTNLKKFQEKVLWLEAFRNMAS